MQKGRVSVNTENIFPIIKKFLYTDHEIFLRELVSNAVDATNKLQVLAAKGEVKGDIGEPKITVSINKDKGTLTISDEGIGMTAEEIDKYINQIAFSGAEEFVEKFKDDKESANIIGHFGLGFYSSFMVADKVEINTLSFQDDAAAAKWTCTGTTEFKITKGKRKKRGTDIVLYINEENKEFLEDFRIQNLLNKYCKFLPVPIEFDGKTINTTDPIWKKSPSDLSDEDYMSFYKELYPMAEDPLFWIHLNVDYPFNLTGILYFPKIRSDIDPNRNKIQLYSNQVYVTDDVSDIVPDYLMLLHGIIDSPDIPLNVSRSSLQADAHVKKITGHISKKVSDKLYDLYKKDQKDFESKWPDIALFVKYGMISDEKFYDRSLKFALLTNVNDEHSLIPDYLEKVKVNQKDKDEQTILLYTHDKDKQFSYIKAAEDAGYDVLVLNDVIDNHFIQHLEAKNEKTSVKRVDADTLDKLIDKDEKNESVLSEEEENSLKAVFSDELPNENHFEVQTTVNSPSAPFIVVLQSEWERRFAEMQKMNPGMASFGGAMAKHKVTLNTNHSLAKRILEEKDSENKKALITKSLNLALIGQGLLKGKDLADFIDAQLESL
jgi:molecular chaperone HtpG